MVVVKVVEIIALHLVSAVWAYNINSSTYISGGIKEQLAIYIPPGMYIKR